MDTTKTPSPTNPSNLFYTVLSPLASYQCQLHPRLQGIVSHAPEKVAVSVACKGEVIHIPEGGGRKFGPDPERGTASVACYGDPKKSGYLTFDPGGISTINWRPTGGQV